MALPYGPAEPDLWKTHEPNLRRLYLEQNLTLKEVKETVETEHGFPPGIALSVYEAQLSKLNLKKNMKKHDWSTIESIVDSRRIYEGKESHVYRHGVQLPSRRLRKEFRRSREHPNMVPLRANPPLPRGIEIRTPPPVRPLSHPLPQPQYQPSPAPVPGLFSPRLDDGIDLDIDLDWDLSLAFDPNSAREVSGPPPVLSSGESFALYYSTPILGDAFVLDDTGPSTQLQPRILDVIRSPIVDSFITFENLRVEFRLILETTPFYCLDLKYDSNGMAFMTRSTRLSPSPGDPHLPYRDHGMIAHNESPVGISVPRVPSALDSLVSNGTSGVASAYWGLFKNLLFLLSNNLDAPTELYTQVLTWLQEHVPASSVEMFFQLDEPTVRVAYLPLLDLTMSSDKQKLSMSLLRANAAVSITRESVIKYMTQAIERGWYDVLELLLERDNPTSDQEFWSGHSRNEHPLFTACFNGDARATRMLLDAGVSPNIRIQACTIFGLVLGIIAHKIDNRQNRLTCAQLLAEAGVDVDLPYMEYYYRYFPETIFDVVKLMAPELLYLVQSFSALPAITTHLTVSGIVEAAFQGPDILTRYLELRKFPKGNERTRMLARSLAHAVFDLGATKSFLQLGVRLPRYEKYSEMVRETPQQSLLSPLSHHPLQSVLWQATQNGLTDDKREIIRLLLEHGFEIDEDMFLSSINKTGTEEMQCLWELVSSRERRDFGPRTMSKAATLGNADAVKYLHSKDVDVNSAINYRGRSTTVFHDVVRSLPGFLGVDEDGSSKTSLDMVRLLVELGGEIQPPNRHKDGRSILHDAMEGAPGKVRDAIVEYLVLQGASMEETLDRPTLLHLCCGPYWTQEKKDKNTFKPFQSAHLFEFLLARGAVVHGGPVIGRDGKLQADNLLTFLIMSRAPEPLIDRIISAGADINLGETTPLQAAVKTGDLALVKKLIGLGADVNKAGAAPSHSYAIGISDYTFAAVAGRGSMPLVVACHSYAKSSGSSKDECLDIIRYLLYKGANVNAMDKNDKESQTAMEIAAEIGDIGLLLLLVYHRGDFNTPPRRWGQCVLDHAAKFGRLDMVGLLLQLGAVSGFEGRTGYDGAINSAEGNHPAIANLIRKFAGQNGPPPKVRWRDEVNDEINQTRFVRPMSSGRSFATYEPAPRV